MDYFGHWANVMASPQQLLIATTPPAGGQSVWIFSDNTTGDYAGVDGGLDDTFLNSYETTTVQATKSDGEEQDLMTREGEFATLIRAPGLGDIPVTRNVTSVTVGLYREDGAGGTPTLKAARLLRDWVENQATWNVYSTGNNWGTAGAANTSSDVSGAVDGSGSGAITASGWQEISFSGLVSDANAVIAGTNDNHGWRIVVAGTYAVFQSSRGADGTRPYIRIETEAA
jgi:hypothetical protein